MKEQTGTGRLLFFRHGHIGSFSKGNGVVALGLLAFGSVGLGLFSAAAVAVGIGAFGGVAVGVFSFGGVSVGWLTVGGVAAGRYAIGDIAVGWLAVGLSQAEGVHAYLLPEAFDALGAFLNEHVGPWLAGIIQSLAHAFGR